MNNFIITTDTTSDLPAAYVEQHQIGMLSLTYTINDTTYSWEHPLPVKEFYDCMRQGSLPTTSQANPEEAAAVFEKIINEQNADILHIAFSSGLSGSYNSARLAAEELSEKYPDRKIIVIDSLCASLGEGLLVHKAVTLKEQGHTLEETADWIEANKLHLVHNFTVNDLFHLFRGLEISRIHVITGSQLQHSLPIRKIRKQPVKRRTISPIIVVNILHLDLRLKSPILFKVLKIRVHT